jgi:hypothetical protein
MSKKVYDLTNPENLSVIRSSLQEDDDGQHILNEDFGEESDIASEDAVEYDGDSDTKQECEETDDEDSAAGTNYFLGKDKITKWSDNPPLRNVQRGPHNVLTHLPGVIGNPKSAKTAVDCWNNLFTDEILDNTVRYTNQYIQSIKDRFTRERDVKTTNVVEIKVFVKLLYLAGAYRGRS